MTQLRANEKSLLETIEKGRAMEAEFRAKIDALHDQMYVHDGALQAIRATIENIEAYDRGGCIDAQQQQQAAGAAEGKEGAL